MNPERLFSMLSESIPGERNYDSISAPLYARDDVNNISTGKSLSIINKYNADNQQLKKLPDSFSQCWILADEPSIFVSNQ